MTEKRMNLLLWKCHVTTTRKDACISNEKQLQILSSTFIPKKKSLPSATSILSSSPITYNTTASLEKLTCTDYVDFGKCQDKLGLFSWSKNDSNYLDEKNSKFSRKMTTKSFDWSKLLQWERQILTSLFD